MAKYKFRNHSNGVYDNEANRAIPNSGKNRHWVAYQQWLADGNTPDPADPLPPPAKIPVVTKPSASDNSIAALRAKMTEIIQVLQDAGLMKES